MYPMRQPLKNCMHKGSATTAAIFSRLPGICNTMHLPETVTSLTMINQIITDAGINLDGGAESFDNQMGEHQQSLCLVYH